MKRMAILALVAVLSASYCLAQAPAHKKALLFGVSNLLQPQPFNDAYQAGAGGKYFLSPALALRALLGIDINSGQTSTSAAFGLGAGVEWHPAPAAVSPYLGGLLGLRTLSVTNQPNLIDLYFGGLVGVEARIYQNLYFYAEYDLIASVDSDGFSLKLGQAGFGGNGALFGLAIYF